MEHQFLYFFLLSMGSTLALHFTYRLISTYLRLRKIPGPRLAAVSNFWLFSKFWFDGNWREICIRLHQKYGPVVRYGPNRVSFSNVAAIPTIFSTSTLFEKAESYDPLLAIANGKEVASFITMRPESRHTVVKKSLGPMWTQHAVSEYEDHVDHTMQELTEQLIRCNEPVVDMHEWLTYFAFDTLSRIGFGEDLGFMTNRKDVDGALAGARERFAHWHYWIAVPRLETLLFKNPLAVGVAKPSSLVTLAMEKIGERRAKGSSGGRPTLLDKYLAASQRDPEIIDTATVLGLTVSTIHAGADTTANTMAIAIYHLLRNPEKLAKLEAELAEAPLSDPPRFSELNKLHYLEAAIKEGMRVDTISNDMAEKTVPPAGAEIAGTFIPGGTMVSMGHHTLNLDPTIWGSAPEAYNPDRWLEVDEEQRRVMEKAFLGFSAGKRVCVGQHIAWLEMKKLIPHLLRSFKMSLARPDEPLKLSHVMIAAVETLPIRLEKRGQ